MDLELPEVCIVSHCCFCSCCLWPGNPRLLGGGPICPALLWALGRVTDLNFFPYLWVLPWQLESC